MVVVIIVLRVLPRLLVVLRWRSCVLLLMLLVVLQWRS